MKITTSGIAIMICFVSLAYISSGASDFTLEIFGNANMDDTIDEQDIEYVQGILDGTNDETELADANHDGKIDEKDIDQIELIIRGEERELTIVDCDGEISTVNKPINKVVAIVDSTVEALRILNAKDKIVGIDEMTKRDVPSFLAELIELPSVGERPEPDVETILELEPDLVILGPRQWHGKDLESKLEGTDIDVARLWLANSDVVLSEIVILGYLLGEVDRAEEYREWHDKTIGEIEEKISTIPEDELPKVFWDRPGKTTCGGESSYQRTLGVAGGKNIAFDLGKYPEVDPEWVLQENPDVVLGLSFMGGYETDNLTSLSTRYDEIIGTPGFDNLKAVKDGKVFITHYIVHVNPGYPVGAAYLAKWLHPELFPELDPQAIHQEYLNEFQGIDFDVKEQGAFVYVP